ncbi:MAG: hypothetical protein IPO88_19500 [Nannocystis sp.]|uniref:hypothetical protein n=1 Tax=Nannocystis sp. TaxID=1962667 RepID=UPI0024243733|nr:hypothetical protein [Nannocystis sp.]MBK9755654.1 hypothetical protein [Nannocystis sp.]
MRRGRLASILVFLLSTGCSSDAPGESHGSTGATSSSAGTTTDGSTTDAPTTGATSIGEVSTSTTTDEHSSSSSGTQAETSTDTSTTGAIECMPISGDEDSTSSGSTGDTGGTGDPPEPIPSWQAYVMAECTALVKCGCAAPKQLGKDLAACVATRSAELAAIDAQGYLWDPICAATRLAGIQQECKLEEVSCEATSCELFHGTAGFAEDCKTVFGATKAADASNCGPTLVCEWHVCITPCSDQHGCDAEICYPGQHCFFDDNDDGYCLDDAGPGQHCDEEIYGPKCWSGLVCAPGEDVFDAKCVQPGASCQGCSPACESGHHCDAATKLCWPLRPGGAPCTEHEACQSLSCQDGQCDPLPGAGAACPQGVCAEGFTCGAASKCYPIAQHGEPCPGLNECATGLTCTFAGVCETPICSGL